MSIANAVYESDWVNKDHKIRIYLQIFILKSQIPFCMTALGFFTVNLQRLAMVKKKI